MSIQKFNSQTKINNQSIPYTQTNSNVAQNLTNMEAGWVWVYLLSKPSNWQVVKEHLKNHFKIGNAKIKSIFSYLHKCNLIEYIQYRDEKGIISHTDIHVLNGENFINIDKLSTGKSSTTSKTDPAVSKKKKSFKNQRTLSTGSIIDPLDNQPAGFWPTTDERYKHIKRKDKKKRESTGAKSAPLSVLPSPEKALSTPKPPQPPKPLSPKTDSQFIPNEENQILAKDLNVDIGKELDSFKNRHNGTKSQTEFGRWLKMAKEYQEKKNYRSHNGSPRIAPSNEVRSTVPWFGPGHPSWEALNGNGANNKQSKEVSNVIAGSGQSNNSARGTNLRQAASYLF